MILVVFVVLLALFVILPLIGVFVWFFISTAITGIVLGGLARLIIPGRQPIGVLATIVAGWIGSLLGGVIGAIIWHRHHHHFATLLIEIGVAAVAVLAFSAGARNNPNLQRGGGKSGHKIIDI